MHFLKLAMMSLSHRVNAFGDGERKPRTYSEKCEYFLNCCICRRLNTKITFFQILHASAIYKTFFAFFKISDDEHLTQAKRVW